jgi:hypothetical protein
MTRARAIGSGITVRCLKSQPPARVSIERWIVAGGWGLGTGDWELGTGDWGLGTGDRTAEDIGNKLVQRHG